MPEISSSAFARWTAGIILLAGVTFSSSCARKSDGIEFARAKGIVIYQGKPLEGGQICFIPDNSKGSRGPMACARIADGEFELQTHRPRDGAMVGFHKVLISRYKETAFNPNNPAPPLAEISLIPPKYADEQTSGLIAEVTKTPKMNVFTFELK